MPEDGKPGWSHPGAGGAQVPGWLRTLVWLLDGAFVIPGTSFRVGLDPLLGILLPGAGDVAGGLASVLLFVVAFRNGVPPGVILRMLVNVGVDAIVGAVPVLGDFFDAAYRSNEKNLELLERHAQPGRRPTVLDYLVLPLAFGAVLMLALLPIVIVVALLKFALDRG